MKAGMSHFITARREAMRTVVGWNIHLFDDLDALGPVVRHPLTVRQQRLQVLCAQSHSFNLHEHDILAPFHTHSPDGVIRRSDVNYFGPTEQKFYRMIPVPLLTYRESFVIIGITAFPLSS